MGLRASSLTFLTLGTLASIASLAGACVSNTNATPAGEDSGVPDLDAGTVPVADAAVQDSAAPDASVPDGAAPDAGTVDAADAGPAPITVLAVDVNGVPETGITVFFSDPNGNLLTTAATGATGTVVELVPAGSQATVIFGSATVPALITIVGVEPGDALTTIDPTSAAATFSEPVTVTALPPLDGGVDFYVGAGGCTAFSSSAPFTFQLQAQSQCEIGGTFPLLAVAQDEDDAPLAFAFQKGVAVAGDGGLDEAGAQEVSMAADSWSAFGSFALSASSAPNNVNLVMSEVAGGVPYWSSSFVSSPTSGTSATTLPSHPGYADFVQAEADYEPVPSVIGVGTPSNGGAISAIATRSAGTTTSAALDLSTALPPLTNAVVDYSNPVRPSVSWSSSAPLNTIDGSIAFVFWTGETGYGLWTFVVPPTATVAQAPVLPNAVSAWGPSNGVSFDTPVVLALEATFWSGYPAFRAETATISASQADTLGNCGDSIANGNGGTPPCLPPLPQDGTLRMSAYTTYNAD